ncbi:nuclear transport factor 2 family protein [uncultured Croceitalea sp.]|uniref:nuclear transport factor 2 family protein n=1 Tax=uncultured Croceitalea sp. TaxID=1798908 RepID=UPI00374E4199
METIQMKINDLNNLAAQGKGLEAFDKYYHDDVIMQENENTPTVGKANNLKREKAFFKEFEEFNMIGPLKVAVGENVSMVEWHYKFIHKKNGPGEWTQVSVQEWKEGKIIKEKFYYNS